MLHVVLKSGSPPHLFFVFFLTAHTMPLFDELCFLNLVTNNSVLSIELMELSFLD